MTAALAVWPVDDLHRVFLTDLPPKATVNAGWNLSAAGGEYCTFQLGVRAQTELWALKWPADKLRVIIDPLRHGQSAQTIEQFQIRWVEFVSLAQAIAGNDQPERPELIPGWYPDQLMHDPPVPKGVAGQPFTTAIHVIFQVPYGFPAGTYAATVRVKLADEEVAALPLQLTVWPFSLPKQPSLHTTNWFRHEFMALWHNAELWSERYWKLLDHYAADMATHRQNVIYTPHIFSDYYFHEPEPLVEITRKRDGAFAFDLRRLEQWVAAFEKHGFQLFELCHCMSYIRGQHAPPFAFFDEQSGQRIAHRELPVSDPLYRDLVGAFLRHLSAWLEQRNLQDRFLLHVYDEPAQDTWEHYVKWAAFCREHAPRLRQIDAISKSDLLTQFGAQIDIPVPLTPHLQDEDAYYRNRARAGERPVWWYVCCGPLGRYANRFIYKPLLDTRMLFWQSYAFNVSGILHWGYNFWGTPASFRGTLANGRILSNPKYEATMAASWNVGDACIVYPPEYWWDERGPDGSLRWEACRAGLQDYELLKMLDMLAAKSSPANAAVQRARELLDRVKGPFAGDLTGYSRDPAELLRLRREIGETIAALQ